jgi:hypothetical protein
MSLKRMLASHSNGPALLNGSDVPVGTKSITITVAAIRESPKDFGAPAIVELKKAVYDKSAWAANKTNLKTIINDYGEDETKLVGMKIKLDVVSARNPKTGEMVRSLAVSPKKQRR